MMQEPALDAKRVHEAISRLIGNTKVHVVPYEELHLIAGNIPADLAQDVFYLLIGDKDGNCIANLALTEGEATRLARQ